MDRDKIDIALGQKRALEGYGQSNLSQVPYYIQNLERKIDTIEYKLNMVLEKLHNIGD